MSLVDRVAAAGVDVLALTDHDTAAGLEAAAQRAGERGIAFVTGIEMTTYAYGRVIHMLGYGFDPSNRALHDANQTARQVWDANQCSWIQSLMKERLNVALDRDFADHPVRLPVLIERLCLRGVDGGDPRRVHARFRSYFAALPPEAYDRLPSPARAASVIREAGGLLLIAHPLALGETSVVEELLPDCDGLEARYLKYSAPQQSMLVEIAERCGKIYSGGSDYHGYFETEYRHPQFLMARPLLERFGALKRA